MTIVVAYNGILAADTLSSDGDGSKSMSVFKIMPLKNLHITKLVDGKDIDVDIIAFGASGPVVEIAALTKVLRKASAKDKQNLSTVLTDYNSPLAKIHMTAIFLLADGDSLSVRFNYRKNGRLAFDLNPKDTIVRCGSGANTLPHITTEELKELGTLKLTYLISRLADGCGDLITHYHYKTQQIKIYTPTETHKDELLKWMKAKVFL